MSDQAHPQSAPVSDEPAVAGSHEGSLSEQLMHSLRSARSSNVSGLTAVVAFIGLSVMFSLLSSFFATPLNFANLMTQAATLVMLAAALTFVMLLGEIDLSAGVTSGVGAAIFVILTAAHGVNWIVAIVAALLFGVITGGFIGLFVAYVRIPSFIVTLGLFLGYQGLQLLIVGNGGLYRVDTPQILAIMNSNLSVTAGWIFYAIVLVIFLATAFYDRRRRQVAGAVAGHLSLIWMKFAVLAVLGGVATYVLNLDRSQSGTSIQGVPYVVPITVLFLWVGTNVLKRTRFGRYLYAIGGNKEAARRAGIKVRAVMWSAFVVCSTLAVVSGIFNASRVGSVDAAAGREIVLSGVAAAVVGGVSLFGGRGSLVLAAVGALLIAVITNGLGLLNLPAGANYAVTGAVLIAAASVDALRRRST